MKTQTIVLTTSLLLTLPSLLVGNSAADQLQMRYANQNGNARFSVSHDIKAGKRDMPADREFNFDLEFSESALGTSVKIDKAKASYTAHGMTQRLPISKLSGKSISLSKVNNDRSLIRTDPNQDLEIPVGQIIGADYPLGLALVDILPVLPEEAVSMGSTWVTVQRTRSLEGWAWAMGELKTEHVVTAVENENGHTIVSVTSKSQAQLDKVEGVLEYSGEGALKRNSDWQFDVNDGRLLSVSMFQSTSGINNMPQGEVDVRQNTRIKFSIEK
jgi:hypothetical protein